MSAHTQKLKRYLLRSDTEHKKVLEAAGLAENIQRLAPLNPWKTLSGQNKPTNKKKTQKQLIDNMASKQDIEDLLSAQRSRKSFEPREFSGKTTENARGFLSSFKNYCALNKIVGDEQILTFEMCLNGGAKSWFLTLSNDVKKDFKSICKHFESNYLQNNKWLNTTRLENRKLAKFESAEKYIEDMSELALLLDIKDEELSKALVRGVYPSLRMHIQSFNPLTLRDTIQRLLIGNNILAYENKDEINALTDNNSLSQKFDERLDRLEDLFKSTQISKRDDSSTPNYYYSQNTSYNPRRVSFNCRNCGIFGHRAADCNRGQQMAPRYGMQTYPRNNMRSTFQPSRPIRGNGYLSGAGRRGAYNNNNNYYRGRGSYNGYSSGYNNGVNRDYNGQNFGSSNGYPKNGGNPRV